MGTTMGEQLIDSDEIRVLVLGADGKPEAQWTEDSELGGALRHLALEVYKAVGPGRKLALLVNGRDITQSLRSIAWSSASWKRRHEQLETILVLPDEATVTCWNWSEMEVNK
jgi:hypothetical protein